MRKTICLLPGDGIGPEIVAEAVKTLRAVEKKFGHEFVMSEALIGGAIESAVRATLAACGVERARLTVSDRGALECVIRARVETAVLRGRGES